MTELKLTFECGCYAVYYVASGRIQGGIHCCEQHGRLGSPRQIERLLPLQLTGVALS